MSGSLSWNLACRPPIFHGHAREVSLPGFWPVEGGDEPGQEIGEGLALLVGVVALLDAVT
jgi:hypothetical protein